MAPSRNAPTSRFAARLRARRRFSVPLLVERPRDRAHRPRRAVPPGRLRRRPRPCRRDRGRRRARLLGERAGRSQLFLDQARRHQRQRRQPVAGSSDSEMSTALASPSTPGPRPAASVAVAPVHCREGEPQPQGRNRHPPRQRRRTGRADGQLPRDRLEGASRVQPPPPYRRGSFNWTPQALAGQDPFRQEGPANASATMAAHRSPSASPTTEQGQLPLPATKRITLLRVAINASQDGGWSRPPPSSLRATT